MDNVKKSLATGINRAKWMASFLVERTKAETSIAKIFYKRSKVEGRIDDLYREIGRRVLDLKEKGETDVLGDVIVQQSLKELKDMKQTADSYKTEAENMSRLRDE